MKTGSILLMLSLGALLLAGISTVAGGSNIRLPSDGDEWPAPPWECCDNLKQSPLRIWPPRFQCLDEVDHCAAACEDCKKVDDDDPRPRYVCQDWYSGLSPGSKCKDDGGDSFVAAAARSRPWKCCDETSCTRSWPPTCSCLDKVESCSSRCDKCEQVESHPPRYRCLDRYHGFPGPKCSTT